MDNDQLSRAQRAKQRQMDADLEKCLEHGPTRRLLGTVIDGAGVFDFPGGPEDSRFREGRRSVGLEIISLLTRVDPMAFVEMQRDLVTERQKQSDRAARDAGEESRNDHQ